MSSKRKVAKDGQKDAFTNNKRNKRDPTEVNNTEDIIINNRQAADQFLSVGHEPEEDVKSLDAKNNIKELEEDTLDARENAKKLKEGGDALVSSQKIKEPEEDGDTLDASESVREHGGGDAALDSSQKIKESEEDGDTLDTGQNMKEPEDDTLDSSQKIEEPEDDTLDSSRKIKEPEDDTLDSSQKIEEPEDDTKEPEEDEEATAIRLKIEEAMTEALLCKCPKCTRPIFKFDGCNKIRCACGAYMCYICRQPIDEFGYEHFEAKDGCPRRGGDRTEEDINEIGRKVRDAELAKRRDAKLVHDPTKL